MKDINWSVSDDGKYAKSVEHAQLAVLMDIRDELKRVNVRLDCHETLRIPRYLRDIRRLLTPQEKEKKRRKKC
jgi:hypothetical protein